MERLKRRRSAVKGRTTLILRKIEDELSEENCNLSLLEEYMEQLTIKENNLRELNGNIEEEIVNMEELEAEIEASQEFEERIIGGRNRARLRIREATERERQGTVESSNRTRETSNHQKANVKLPRLILTKFNGDTSKWLSFWNQFESSIHENEGLSKTDKLSYLIAYLEGGAANALAGLPLSADNYDVALNILKKRFGKRELCINAHMQGLLNLTPVKRSSELAALRKLYDSCEVQVRSLETLGVASEAYGSLLCPILMKLIPPDIALEFSRKQEGTEEWKVIDLLEHLRREVESRERAAVLNRSEHETNYQDAQGPSRERNAERKNTGRYDQKSNGVRQRFSTTAALNTAANAECIYCKGGHSSGDCKELSLEERKQKLREMGSCFICLGKAHIAKYCKSKGHCKICGRRHHTSICFKSEDLAIRGKPASEDQRSKNNNESVVSAILPSESSRSVLLQTAKVMVEGEKRRFPVRCLFDGGSQRSFITKEVAQSLGLVTMGEETLNLHTFGSDRPEKTTRKRITVKLSNIRNSENSIEIEVLETPQISSALISIPGESIRKEMRIRNLPLADETDANCEQSGHQIAVLIGADHYWKIVSGNLERLGHSLVALESLFGWLVQGPTSVSLNLTAGEVSVHKVSIEEETISEGLKTFWELETIGIVSSEETSELENSLIKEAESSMMYKDKRYEVCLPWKQDREGLGGNLGMAHQRMRSLARRLQRDPIMWQRYQDTINEYSESGIIEHANAEGLNERPGQYYYVPHHPVVREDKMTTKLRIVFDASSHEASRRSLNECLYPGPNLNPDLMGILLRFRTHRIGFMADIEKAFLQVSLAERDREFTRFLWFAKRPIEGGLFEFEHYRMTRVMFGVTSSPFLLAVTLQHHIKKWEPTYPEVCRLLVENLYIDDFISGADTDQEILRVSSQASAILKEASMNLRKWVTSSKHENLLMKDTVEQHNGTDIMITKPASMVLKVLGLAWNPREDILTFEVSGLLSFLQSCERTKRAVLGAAARVYDPLGFLAPFLIVVKCIFQELWVRGLKWDEELPSDLDEVWKKWCLDLTKLPKVSLFRWFYDGTDGAHITNRTFHVFSDASEKAYAAVVYLRCVTDTGLITVSLVASKARVAPLKKISVPRLELMGALIGARLLRYVTDALKSQKWTYRCWTDSTIVCHWIKGLARNWKPFVSNRVVEIQGLTEPRFWSHCDGKENPADSPTRGLSMDGLLLSNLWWRGPKWLSEEERFWPVNQRTNLPNIEADCERRVSALIGLVKEEVPEAIVKIECFSSLNRLLRVTAWVLRFVQNLRSKEENGKRHMLSLTSDEIQAAERYWISQTQNEAFHEEIQDLKSGKPIKRNSPILNLDPFYVNGVLAISGRLQHANLGFREKHPMILPNKHKFTELVVKHQHELLLHAGINDTLIQIRETFWIIKGRQLVKRIIGQCLICRRFRAKRGAEVPSPLPQDRVIESPPFEVTGLDFAGPLFIKGNPLEKVYIALFTCAVTRAVHLELLTNMSCEMFLLAFRRFISRRGVCRQIYSDNARSFKRADQELSKMMEDIKKDSFQNYLGHRKIEWKYIVERAAWWGGFWERLVRSVKSALKRVLGRSLLAYEELNTIVTEVESVLNSRPLTFTLNEVNEPAPLTPSHFLVGKRLTSLPVIPNVQSTKTASRDQLTRRLRYRENILDKTWQRWRHEYLMELRSAHECKRPKEIRGIKVDDIVLVEEDKLPRQVWKMGRVVQVFPGRDGKIRACALRLPGGTIIRRPVQLLFSMEIELPY